MSETSSLEPNQPENQPESLPGEQPDKQPERVLPGDDGPQNAATAAQDGVREEDAVEAARTLIGDEPAALLHDQAPAPVEEPPVVRLAPQSPLAIDHVPSVGHAYPGEPIDLHTRVRIREDVLGFELVIEMPQWVHVTSAIAPAGFGVYTLDVGEVRDELRWELLRSAPAGASFEFVTTVVAPALDHLVHAFSSNDVAETEISSDAVATSLGADDDPGRIPVAATAVIALRRKGGYLKYLPAVYERDPFMARFLMLFESFWAPIDGQIETMADYFDPMITTLPMLKWLAERLDLKIDDELAVPVVRQLVAKAVPLYRRRGTRSGLEELLEIYTGGVVQIVERRANNLRLGNNARLGHGVALGLRNQPHTFTLSIKLPPIADDPLYPAVSERQRERRRERIRTLVELEKPAHVTYTLEIDEA